MIQRPKPGEGEDDILRMQEEFLREKNKNQNLQPAAQVVNLRRSEPTKRASTSDSTSRKPSKYAQTKGLINHSMKNSQPEEKASCLGDILEKQHEDTPAKSGAGDDQVYFPKVIPSVLGNIVEKNTEAFVELGFKSAPPQGFPVVTKRNPIFHKTYDKTNKSDAINRDSVQMDIDEATNSSMDVDNALNNPVNLPTKSYVLSSNDASEIHNENVNVLSKMSEIEILEEKQKLLASLDPKLLEYLKSTRQQSSRDKKTKTKVDKTDHPALQLQHKTHFDKDTLWENDILAHPKLNNWLHFNTLEKDKLEWMKGINESKRINPDEPYEARFDFKGYLLPYTIEYTEQTKTLFHHGEEPHRPGYSLSELIEFSRSAVTQQRVMALNTIAGILEYYSVGTYKDIIEIPISKIFFIIRFSMDENKTIILEPALRAMRNLLYNRIDEASLDALIGFSEGTQQPCLENDKSEIEELESKESELKDFHLAEIDLIAALLRTDILQRFFYIFDTVKPTYNCVQYSLQILTRLARDSVETANTMVQTEHLMRSIIKYFVPITSINFAFEPQILYNGKPILAALRLLRVLSLQSQEISNILVSKYDILRPISEYIGSGIDGTYGLRVQIEAYCILSNLLEFNVGLDNATSLFPVMITAFYKHVQGTDIFVNSSIISVTHAAVVLQFMNIFLNCNHLLNLEKYKQQIYPLLKEGVQKWIKQLGHSDGYTCGHLRLLCSTLDCCKTVLLNENVTLKFLNDILKDLAVSKGFNELLANLVPSSNLLSGITNRDLHFTKNLKVLGTSVVDRAQKVLPLLNIVSPIPFLASLFKLLSFTHDRSVTNMFVGKIGEYLGHLANKVPSLGDNWFTRIETEFLFNILKVSIQSDIPESNKDLLYTVSNKLCYILRADKRYELEYIFRSIVFNKYWFTAERLLNLVSLSDNDGFSKALRSIDDIRICYSNVINMTCFSNVNMNYKDTGPNIVLRKWQEPILPRDWIYLPLLMLYGKSQETETTPTVVGEHAKIIAAHQNAQREMIISCSLEWILFNELCFPDLLRDIDVTDRFCRIMCVFLCDNSLFLEPNIKILLNKCTQLLFKRKTAFNFNRQFVGLNNFQDFYTQLLEQFQSVSYGDHTFAACVLVPIAQKHDVKWRKLLWSEYAGCLRALDCPETLLCYDMNDYLYPEETDESLIKSYFQGLSGSLLRPGTITHRIATHHVEMYKTRIISSKTKNTSVSNKS